MNKQAYLVAHGIPLEAEFLGEVQEDILDFFVRYGDLLVGGPSGIWVTGANRSRSMTIAGEDGG